jgi:hypothetical protein
MTKNRKKYIEQWWRKYEAMAKLEKEINRKFPPAPRVFSSLMNSTHRVWRLSGKASVLIKADIEHHIAMQKLFKKWREVYDERV